MSHCWSVRSSRHSCLSYTFKLVWLPCPCMCVTWLAVYETHNWKQKPKNQNQKFRVQGSLILVWQQQVESCHPAAVKKWYLKVRDVFIVWRLSLNTDFKDTISISEILFRIFSTGWENVFFFNSTSVHIIHRLHKCSKHDQEMYGNSLLIQNASHELKHKEATTDRGK